MNEKVATSPILVVCLLLATACGQQAAPATQSSATQKKGQIAQPEVKPSKAADASSLLVTFHGCADLVLSDTRGRKLGYDAVSKKSYQQIPGGIYDEGDLISDDEDTAPAKAEAKSPPTSQDCASDKTVQVPQPLAGSYNLVVNNSTGKPFKLQITSYGAESKQNGQFVVSQPAGAAAISTYQFQLPPPAGGHWEVKLK